MYKKQFLLTRKKNFKFNWKKKEVGAYNLYYHPDLEYTFAQGNHVELSLVGSMYDYENAGLLNKHIVEKLVFSNTLEELFLKISKYSGEYILIYKQNDEIIIFNDACAQSEIYYDESFSCFATQPKLIAEVIETIPHDDLDANEFYTSNIFKRKCFFPGDSTHIKNIKHLRSNHYININKRVVHRFYPVKPISELSLDEVAKRASIMIKGYIEAISLRHKIAIPVTGGYDSRVLFLASLKTKAKYFVSKHPDMTNNHYDITIPRKLTSFYSKKFYIISDNVKVKNDFGKEYINSIDFPRYINIGDIFKGYVIINGNISEIARNYFGYYKNISPEDLSFLMGFSTHKYPSKQYDAYLKTNKIFFENFGYNFLDMFYWEEKMGNWGAKGKTEAKAFGKIVISPFNSRDLLTLLLSVKREYRDSHYNQLYDRIIYYLSSNNINVLKLPVNPCTKQRIIRIMKKFNIYNLYRNIGLRTRIIKI